MKSLRFLPLLLVFAVLLVAAGCGGGSAGVPSDSVAVVNGDSITKVQFNTLMNATTKIDKANKQTPPAAGTTAYKTRQDQILAYLVQLDELTQKGKTLGVEVTDAQVQQQVDKVKKQYFKGDEKKFEAGLLGQGLTLPIYKLEWRAQLLSNKIYAKVTKGVKVTDAQVTAYYNTHKSSYTTKESRDVRHILVNSKSLADKLEAQLKAGADFAKLAKKYSKDPSSATQGGKLTITKGETVPSFDKVAFSIKTNVISAPVHSQYGWHIIEALSAVRPEKVTPLASVKQTIQQTLLQTKKTDAMNGWVAGVKKAYAKKISYAVGYTPSATTTATTTAPAPTTTG
jgi:foldase protein PrsA